MNKRIEYIDRAKGIAIQLVVIGYLMAFHFAVRRLFSKVLKIVGTPCFRELLVSSGKCIRLRINFYTYARKFLPVCPQISSRIKNYRDTYRNLCATVCNFKSTQKAHYET